MKQYDAIVVGAGVVGAAVARELSRRKGSFLVVERALDVCEGTSKANSAIMHAGFDAEPGTMKAKMNVRGNQMMDQLSGELDIPFRRVGAFVVCFSKEELPKLKELYDRGVANGVSGMELLTGEQARALEPNLSEEVEGALLANTSGIVCPFELTLGLAESAAKNGVEFSFDTQVTGLERAGEGWMVHTSQGNFAARAVVNAAGVFADEIHNWVCEDKLHITPRRGEYCLLDHTAGAHVSRTVFQLPGKYGKGVLVSPTVHGNLIVGPTAIDIEDREATATTRQGLDELIDKAGMNVKNLPMRQVITSFAGLRAHEDHHEFIIEELEDAPGFVDCAGIESPGLTSCPAIGRMVAGILKDKMGLEPNTDFVGTRKGILDPDTLTKEERAKLIQEKPAYGNIICRCEMVTEGEILDAIHRPLGARSLDGIKRRTRAGMGRCQAGFCTPRSMELLHRELGLPMTEITKSGGDSKLVVGTNKDRI